MNADCGNVFRGVDTPGSIRAHRIKRVHEGTRISLGREISTLKSVYQSDFIAFGPSQPAREKKHGSLQHFMTWKVNPYFWLENAKQTAEKSTSQTASSSSSGNLANVQVTKPDRRIDNRGRDEVASPKLYSYNCSNSKHRGQSSLVTKRNYQLTRITQARPSVGCMLSCVPLATNYSSTFTKVNSISGRHFEIHPDWGFVA